MRLLAVIATIAVLVSRAAATDSYSLFDLSVDPYESNDLYDSASSDSSNEYYSQLNELKTKIDSWSDIASPQVPESFSKHKFATCGGVCPWVESEGQPVVTEVKYTPEASPNIVFIMASDWGWNDAGFRSTYLSWATPNIDQLADEGIMLDNYFTHSSSLPSRGAFLTGRYPSRLGLWGADSDDAELPTSEITLGTEFQSAGYKTYMVGKWGVGMSTLLHTPLERGFDHFYGQLSSETDPFTKKYSTSYLDLYQNNSLVAEESELSSDLHVASLYQMKAEEFITSHVEQYPESPMFMFYSLPLLQSMKSEIPDDYLSRCSTPNTIFDDDAALQLQYYCAMIVMMDEIIGNLTCSLVNSGMANNTLLVLTSDNGGDMSFKGNNYPFAGGKDANSRGGISVTALLHGAMLKSSALAGKTYSGQMHVTDWLPTLMQLATNGEWSQSYGGSSVELDGFDMWAAIVGNLDSPRSEILHCHDGEDTASIQTAMVKLDKNPVSAKVHKPEYVFSADADSELARSLTCSYASLMYPTGEPDYSALYRLYDLDADPYEQSNLYGDDDYSDNLSYLKDLGEVWQAMLTEPQIPDTTNKLDTWTNECDNAVCAWDTTTEFSPLKQTDPHKNSYKPHIMFVVVDNWGYNDMGAHSSYLSWTTPNIDRLAEESILLTNYYTHSTSLPSRAAILTGRYAARTGMWDESNNVDSTPELPLEETTLAQEMKELGYMTYMVGKWNLGASTEYHWPNERGFDYFFGQITDSIDPYTKLTPEGVLDQHNCTYYSCDVYRNIDESIHSVFEYEARFEEYFQWHSTYHSRQPMFLYYALPMMQYPYEVPDYYKARCAYPTESGDLSDDDLQALQNYCASSVLLDEVITNMTCTIKASTTRNNTVIVITSSNGGLPIQVGSNYPFKGYSTDGSAARGAVSVNAIIHGSTTTIATAAVGSVYSGQMHAVDWYPTLLTFASGQQWKSSFTGAELDGVNMWQSIMASSTSPRADIVHFVTESSYSVQSNMIKYDHLTTYIDDSDVDEPLFTFSEDLDYRLVAEICYKPSLLYSFTDPNDIYYLYDLITDPHEKESIADSSPDLLSSMWERCDYWNTQVIDPTIPASTGKTSTFNSCGGICPWLPSESGDDEASTTTDAVLYSYDSAPHIIFVLVDDWGWNDVGYRSTYMGWTTPNIDKLAGEGIKFNNYFSHFSCMPSRGAFLTGRYAMRLGLWQAHENAELPLNETTIAQEMKSAGYRTALIGKWHQGYSTVDHLPMSRGFDVFYGYLNGYVDYWTKSYGSHLDLHDGFDLETDSSILDPSVHNGYVLQSKVEQLIADHATNYADQPLFLYYAMQLIHGVWAAPDIYLKRCSFPSTSTADDDYIRDVEYQYCAMNVMLDEAIANLTCTLEAFDMLDNTVMVVVSDNGGEQTVSGNSFPFRGGKGSHFRGGISTTGFVHSALIPDAMKGMEYDGQFHITDWLPTLMGLATGGAWTGSLSGAQIDGVDMWDAITSNLESPHTELLHYADGVWGCSVQQGMTKLDVGDWKLNFNNVTFVFEEDLHPEYASLQCEDPSLMSSSMSTGEKATLVSSILANDGGLALFTSSKSSRSSSISKSKTTTVHAAVSVNDSNDGLTYSVVTVALIAIVFITFAGVLYRVNKISTTAMSPKQPVEAVEHEVSESSSLLGKTKV